MLSSTGILTRPTAKLGIFIVELTIWCMEDSTAFRFLRIKESYGMDYTALDCANVWLPPTCLLVFGSLTFVPVEMHCDNAPSLCLPFCFVVCFLVVALSIFIEFFVSTHADDRFTEGRLNALEYSLCFVGFTIVLVVLWGRYLFRTMKQQHPEHCNPIAESEDLHTDAPGRRRCVLAHRSRQMPLTTRLRTD